MLNDIPEIKQGLKDRIADLCAALLPRGKREGGMWVSHNPRVAGDDKKIPALKVGLQRDKGAWICWRSGDKGDVIKLIAFCLGTDTRGALQWARDFLGLRTMSREERQQFRAAAQQRESHEAEQAVKARAFKLRKAIELFELAAPCGSGGAAEAHARDYFRGRGCGLEGVTSLNSETLRFSPASEWWKGAEWTYHDGQRRRVKPGPKFPAVHTAMRQATGIVTCCHVTFLDPLTPAKAPVAPPKLMFGEALGAVIEIAMGPSATPFWLCATPHPLIICEGIETALSLAQGIADARIWAAGSLAGMRHAPVQLSCVSDITVARDNNAGNAQAQAQLMDAVQALSEAEKPLVIMQSHVGDDFNDLM